MQSLRMQPPVATRVGIGAALHGLLGLKRQLHYRQSFECSLKAWLGAEYVWTVSSGKAALAVVLTALGRLSPGRTDVIVPAYTCFSVPSAVVRAGFKVVLCDIEESTLDFDFDKLASLVGGQTLCVVSCDLFGAPVDTSRLRALCGSFGTYVVEDAAQAMGIEIHGRKAGAQGDVGIFSVGRGKCLDAGGGGIIVTSSRSIAAEVNRCYQCLPRTALAKELISYSLLLGQTIFARPWLFWIPASIPQLKIGATTFDDTFCMERLSGQGVGLLWKWKERTARDEAVRRGISDYYTERIRSKAPRHDALPYLRYPIVLESAEQKERVVRWPESRRLGLSPMYPSSIDAIPQLLERGVSGTYPVAASVAARLITAPTHHLIERRDMLRICDIVNSALSGMPL